jgi:pimeloyl-ACP methyl ester carboxylesterase
VHPHRFRRLVLAGVGRTALERDAEAHDRILAAIEGRAPDDDTVALLFAQYSRADGNDPIALAAVFRREAPPLTPAELAGVTCPVLVAIGDKDFAGPADELAGLLPDATLKLLRNTDHFATPESFAFIDAALGFIDAQPA